MVQGEVEGVDQCFSGQGIDVCVDEETQQLHGGRIVLDYVPSQGFRLYTNSEFLATHLRIHDHIAEV